MGHWSRIYRDTAFFPYKEELSQDLDLLDALKSSIAISRDILKIDDEYARIGLFGEALQNIIAYLKRNHPADIKSYSR